MKFLRKVLGVICFWAICGGCFGLICFALKADKNREQKEMGNVQERKICGCVVNSNSEKRASGVFILGTGIISSGSSMNVKYYFYMQGEKGFSLEELDANDVEIIETDEVPPHIEGHFNEYGDLYKSMDMTFFSSEEYKYEMTHYDIYIPVGYITEEYKMDLFNAAN